jgi:hypothetical protein
MTAALNELAAPRRGFLGALRHSMPRNELFAGLYILGCVNGLGGLVIQGAYNGDWVGWVLSISVIVLFACAAGIALMLDDTSRDLHLADLVVAAIFLFFVTLSVGALIWVSLSGLSLYILLFTKGQLSCKRKRAAFILLAVTVPMLWSKLLFAFIANWILQIDASFVAAVLGTDRVGNMVRFADGSGNLVIFPNCSSLANVSLAVLCWVTATQVTNHRWSPWDIIWFLLACASVVAVNVTRMSLEGLSHAKFIMLHNQWGDMIFNTATLILTIGICALGVRRELFVRA